MSNQRVVFAVAVLFSLFATGMSLVAEENNLVPVQPPVVSVEETQQPESQALEAQAPEARAEAGCEATESSFESEAGMSMTETTFDNGGSEMVFAAGGKSCGGSQFLGCCSGGTKKWTRKWCCVGPDCFWEYNCSSSCPM